MWHIFQHVYFQLLINIRMSLLVHNRIMIKINLFDNLKYLYIGLLINLGFGIF